MGLGNPITAFLTFKVAFIINVADIIADGTDINSVDPPTDEQG